jgi:hypothetical protein
LCSNPDLALVFDLFLQSNPCHLKTSYLFNRNSIFSDFCAKSFVATKPI